MGRAPRTRRTEDDATEDRKVSLQCLHGSLAPDTPLPPPLLHPLGAAHSPPLSLSCLGWLLTLDPAPHSQPHPLPLGLEAVLGRRPWSAALSFTRTRLPRRPVHGLLASG